MKQFTIIKDGYSTGIYGCSDEYFTCIYNNSKGLNSFSFSGMYGAEERVAKAMKSKGFQEKYTPHSYGQVKIKDMPSKLYLGEYQTLNSDGSFKITV